MTRVWWMPPNGALHGAAIDRLMFWNLAALLTLFVIAHIVFLVLFIRPKPRVSHPSQNEGKNLHRPLWRVEMVLLAVLAILYAWMAVTANRLWATIGYQGSAPKAIKVEVTGVQFQWYFRYPGPDGEFGKLRPDLINAPGGNPLGIDPADVHGTDDFVSSVLVLPAGREVDLALRSTDVIHGFFIPGMRLKQNTVPGMQMHIHFTPSVPGDYAILCSQVCGLGHARMQTRLRVVPEAEYRAWLADHEKGHQP